MLNALRIVFAESALFLRFFGDFAQSRQCRCAAKLSGGPGAMLPYEKIEAIGPQTCIVRGKT